jgi:hypothetical protein
VKINLKNLNKPYTRVCIHNIIFFVSSDKAQQARVFYYTRLERFAGLEIPTRDSIMPLSIMVLNIMIMSIMTPSIMILSIITFSKITIFITRHSVIVLKDMQYNNAQNNTKKLKK